MKSMQWGMMALMLSSIGCAPMGRVSSHRPVYIDTSSGWGPRYLQAGQDVQGRALDNMLASKPESSSDISIAKAMRVVSVLMGVVGGGLIGWPLGQALAGERDPKWALAGVGAGLAVLSIPISALAVYSTDNAVKAHNRSLQTEEKPESAPVMASKPKMEALAPLEGGAGFRLGGDATTAEARCKEGGFEWQVLNDRQFSCSGAPVNMGMPATVKLGMCGGNICKISMAGSFEYASWSSLTESFDKLFISLEQAYGKRSKSETTRLKDCGDILPKCIEAGRARKSSNWSWPSGERVSLVLWGGPVGAQPSLHVFYTNAAYAKEKL